MQALLNEIRVKETFINYVFVFFLGEGVSIDYSDDYEKKKTNTFFLVLLAKKFGQVKIVYFL